MLPKRLRAPTRQQITEGSPVALTLYEAQFRFHQTNCPFKKRCSVFIKQICLEFVNLSPERDCGSKTDKEPRRHTIILCLVPGIYIFCKKCLFCSNTIPIIIVWRVKYASPKPPHLLNQTCCPPGSHIWTKLMFSLIYFKVQPGHQNVRLLIVGFASREAIPVFWSSCSP